MNQNTLGGVYIICMETACSNKWFLSNQGLQEFNQKKITIFSLFIVQRYQTFQARPSFLGMNSNRDISDDSTKHRLLYCVVSCSIHIYLLSIVTI